MQKLTNPEIAKLIDDAKVKCVHPNAETTRDIAHVIETALRQRMDDAVEALALKWKEAHGFDKHGVGEFIRSEWDEMTRPSATTAMAPKL